MPPRRSAESFTSDDDWQAQQDGDTPYVPMGQEDSIAEQSQRRSLASFLGRGDKKDKRRSSNFGDVASIEAPSSVKSGKGWWASSRSVSAEAEVSQASASSRTATLQPRGQATLAPKAAPAGEAQNLPPLQLDLEPTSRDRPDSPRLAEPYANGDAGHERPPSARTAQEATQSQGGEDAKRKHRRNRSLGSLGGILSLKSRGKDEKGKDQPTTPTGGSVPASPFVQTSGRSETAPVSTLLAPPSAPAAGPLMAASARPRTAELPQKMSCFGIRSGARSMGSRNPTEEDELGEDEKVVKPARAEPAVAPVLYGMVGLKSIDNTTCFVGAAVQCLRHAAELAHLLIPNLEADMAAARSDPEASRVASTGPAAAALPSSSTAPATPSSSPHSSFPHGLPQGSAQAAAGSDSTAANAASMLYQQADSNGGSPQAPTTPQTSASRHSAFSAGTAGSGPGLENHSSDSTAGARYSGIMPLLQDESPRGTSSGGEGLGPFPPPLGPRPSMKVDSTLLSSYNRVVTEASLGSRSSMDLCRPLSDFNLDARPATADGPKPEAPAPLPIGTPRPPSLLKQIANSAKGPAVKGDLARAVGNLVRELYCAPPNTAADVSELLQAFARLPAGQDFVDGNQHDCQEFLHNLIDALHEDLGTGRREPQHSEGEAADEGAKGDRSWEEDAAMSDSCVRQLMRGQVQSSVICSKCHVRSTTYEPFWDVSLSLAQPQGKNGSISSWFMLNKMLPASISDCLAAHTGDELLQGDEAFHCDTCACATPATRKLRFHRLPRVLILHLKRFGVGQKWNEKLATHITFPVKGLKMGSYMSDERVAAGEEPVYDLFAVSNHYGSPQGGHYTAFCKAPTSTVPFKEWDGAQWLSFNDEAVAKMNTSNVESSCAYMMFYIRRS